MPTRITHVRFHRVIEHEAEVSFRWRVESGHRGETDRMTMIEWLEQGGEVVIGEGRDEAPVAVVTWSCAEGDCAATETQQVRVAMSVRSDERGRWLRTGS